MPVVLLEAQVAYWIAARAYHSVSPAEPGVGTLSPFSLAHSARTAGCFSQFRDLGVYVLVLGIRQVYSGAALRLDWGKGRCGRLAGTRWNFLWRCLGRDALFC